MASLLIKESFVSMLQKCSRIMESGVRHDEVCLA
jgi:hypothetical protein